MTENAMEGIELLRELKLLHYILPELEEGYKVSQNKHNIYTVWEHNMLALKYATDQNWDYIVRIASLLHDVAKPRVKRGEGENATFHGPARECSSLGDRAGLRPCRSIPRSPTSAH